MKVDEENIAVHTFIQETFIKLTISKKLIEIFTFCKKQLLVNA